MAASNNKLNNQIPGSTANTIKTFVVSNSDNTGTSAAKMSISVGGSVSSGDSQESYIVSGATTWSMGCDNSDSDNLVVCPSATLGTNNAHVITTNGQNRWPKQPAVLGVLTSTSLNRTGNGTAFTIGAATAPYTVVFNKGTNITLGVFTAPVAGTYLFMGSNTLTGCTINNGIQIQLSTTNKIFVKTLLRTASAADNCVNMNAVGTMAAADTAILRISGFGEASNTDDVVGGTATPVTYFVVYKLS